MIGRLLKRLLHRLIRALVYRRVVAVVVVALVLAGLAAGLFELLPQANLSLNLSLPGPSRAPESTENYLKGTQSYDARLIWNSLSDDALQRYQARVGTVDDLQRQLDQAKAKGAHLDQIDYVGGKALPDGTSLQFYIVTSRGPVRGDVEYVPYIFTLDGSGKIARVQ